jgi:transglutaminase-like putative cysteine protease
LRVPAEVALALFTLATAAGFRRLFTDAAFLVPVAVSVVASHAVAAFLRRRRVPLAVAAVLSAAAMVVLLSLVFYAGTTRLGLPTGLTWQTFLDDLVEGTDRFRREQAPVVAATGFVAGSAIAFWIVAFLADWSAFRLRAPIEATVPAASLFVFASLLGADQWRAPSTAAFFVSAAAFLLLHRSARLEASPNWLGGEARRGSRARVRSGAGIVAAAALAVAAVGPLLPGARSTALFDVKDLGGQSSRVTISPLVDIRRRLVDQRDTVAFTVQSNAHAYWRLTALDQFDGRTWRTSKRFDPALGDLPPSGLQTGTFRPVEQRFAISGLAQIWLPAAFEARNIDDASRDVRWDPSTGTLIVDRETSDGMTYAVTSAVPSYSAEQLRAAVGPLPDAVADEFLRLPSGFPATVTDLARRITAGADTPYDAALALQDYFRTNYEYSLDVEGGEDIDAITDFLFGEPKAGYCEQFAGTFAAMARSIGLPSRVGVGFTLGDPDPDVPNTYVVKGRHAHAWPEVFLAGVGWVLFEPTPGRGAPNAPYTNTVESQDSDVAPGGSTTTTAAPDPTATTDPTADAAADPPPADPPPATGAGTGGPSPSVADRTIGLATALGLLVVAYVLVVLGARGAARAMRRRNATDETARVELAWREALGDLEFLRTVVQPGETPSEFATRTAASTATGPALAELAALTTTARYAPGGAASGTAERSEELRDEIRRQVRSDTSRARRISHRLDPRRDLRRLRSRRDR